MKQVILQLIRFYQKYLSFDTAGILRFLFPAHSTRFTRSGHVGRICRFSPTCSEYTYQAVERYGIIDGLWLGVKRVVRCHPWNKGGIDPIPNNL